MFSRYFLVVRNPKTIVKIKIKQKAENRKVAVATMKAAAGQDPKAMADAEELKRQLTTKKTQNNTTKPKPRRATINGQVLVEDLDAGQWIVESTGKPFVQ